jgi:hypothetical protein
MELRKQWKQYCAANGHIPWREWQAQSQLTSDSSPIVVADRADTSGKGNETT